MLTGGRSLRSKDGVKMAVVGTTEQRNGSQVFSRGRRGISDVKAGILDGMINGSAHARGREARGERPWP